MSVLTIAVVGGAIATGFYYMNKDTATSKKSLRESTAMVFVLSTGVMLFAKFLGLGDSGDGGAEATSGGGSVTYGPKPGVGSSSLGSSYKARGGVPLDYIIGGEPPF